MTLHEAINLCNEQMSDCGNREDLKQLASWLKELESLRAEKKAVGFENAYNRGYECGQALKWEASE